MKKINKLFTVLLFAALSVISCKNNFSELENEIEYTTEKAYLSFGINESEERMVAPSVLPWQEVASIELTKNGSAWKTWTSYAQMKADTSIVLDAGKYTFAVTLKNKDGDILQTGELKDVEIKGGNNLLNFKTKGWLEGKGRLSVNCFVDNPISVKKVSVKLDDVVVEALSLNDDKGQLYSPIPLGTAEVDCGNYLITIFINEEKVITDFIEIQNKRETVYNYHYDEKTNVYPVKFLLDDGKDTLVEFEAGKTIDTYITGGELPDPSTITNIPISCEFWGWYCDGKKITKLPENPNGQVIVKARYGKSVTNAGDLKNSLDNGVKSFKITPEDNDYWTKLVEEINSENNITVILDLTNISFEDNKISFGYFNKGGEFTPTVTEIVIPASVTEIEWSAFDGCTQLESVTFAEDSKLKKLGSGVFSGCSSLKGITIPKGVTEFSESTFKDCTSLKKVIFEEGSELTSMRANEFAGCTSLEEIVIPESVTSFASNAFDGCTNLKNFTIPSSLATNTFFADKLKSSDYKFKVIVNSDVAEYAFGANLGLVEVEISDSVTSIGTNGFSGCESLKKITFAEGSELSSIGDYAFYYCTSLEEIVIPASVGTIGEYAFYHCDKLKNVTFENDSQLNKIQNHAFKECTSLEEISIPASVTSLGKSFYNCEKLKKVTFEGNSITEIPSQTFGNCDSLEEITIPAGVTKIGNNAFSFCTSLKKVTFAEDSELSSIGYTAFYKCSSLEEIEIPASLTEIDEETFKECIQLKTVTFAKDSKLTSIGRTAFCECDSLEKIQIPASVTTLGSSSFKSCKNLKTVTFEEGSKLEELIGYVFENCSSLEEISIPASVKSLGYNGYVFHSCTKLKKVTFEGNLITEIPFNTFENCESLEKITIPSSVTKIGSHAFEGCTNLKKVTYLGDKSKITFGADVFKDTQVKEN